MFGFGSRLPGHAEKLKSCESKASRRGKSEALRDFRQARLRIEDERAFSECIREEGLSACRKRWDDEEREAARSLLTE
jgi:hypothetical protein